MEEARPCEKLGPVTVVTLDRPSAQCGGRGNAKRCTGFVASMQTTSSGRRVPWRQRPFLRGWDLQAGAQLPHSRAASAISIQRGDDKPWRRMAYAPVLLSKPVIAAVSGAAVAGGMELALWCDMRVMEEDAYFGVYCRRFGVPLIDGGTVRLPRLVGLGHAMDLILTGRKVEAAEALQMGLCNRVVPKGDAREAALALARQLTKFPQRTMLADRMNAYQQWDLPLPEALHLEWERSKHRIADGLEGATRFAGGEGRHGKF
jgi:enoyl-CoA hydratase